MFYTSEVCSASFRTKIKIAALTFILVALCVFLTQLLGPGHVSPVWAPSGFVLALLLFYGNAIIPHLAVGLFLGMFFMGLPFGAALTNMIANILEGLIAVSILRRYADIRHSQLHKAVAYAAIACGIASPFSAVLGSSSALLHGYIANSWIGFFATWWLGDSLGILVMGPFTLAVLHYLKDPDAKVKERRTLQESKREAILLASGLVLTMAFLFSNILPANLSRTLGFLLLPYAVWGAMRFGPLVSTGITLLIATVLTGATIFQVGFFTLDTTMTSLVALSLFLGVMALSTLLIAGAVADRNALEARLRKSENQLNLLVDNFPNGRVAIFDHKKRFTLFGGLRLGELKTTAQHVMGRTISEIFPLQKNGVQEKIVDRTLAGESCIENMAMGAQTYEVRSQPVYNSRGDVQAALVISQDITHRLELEKSLKSNHEFLQTILDTLPEPVYFKDKDLRYQMVNKAFSDSLNRPPEEVIGKTSWDIAKKELAEEYHAKDIELLASTEGKQFYCTMGMDIQGRFSNICFSKAVVDAERFGGRCIVGAIHDVTELEKAKEDLAASERKYRTLFSDHGSALLLADAESGVILDANKQAGTLWEVPYESLIGKHQGDLHPQEHREHYKEVFRRYLAGDNSLMKELKIVTATGKLIPVEIRTAMLEHEGKQAVLGMFLDISERQKLEQLRQDIEIMNRHDLKAPLNGIIGLPTVLLDDDNITDKQREILQIINDAGLRMLHLINLSLVLFSIENGRYVCESESFDLLLTLHAILNELKPAMREYGVSATIVRQDAPPEGIQDAPFTLLGERMLCYSLFSNLVANAMEASPKQGTIEIVLSHHDGEAAITLRNKGVVPEAIRTRFFEKYVTSGKRNGTGMGTYSARLLAEAQGGSISMQTSDATNETAVTVKLPC